MSLLALAPVLAAQPALAGGWGCAAADAPILHGTSTKVTLTAPQGYTITDSSATAPGAGATLTKDSATTYTFASTEVHGSDPVQYQLQFTLTATNDQGSMVTKIVRCSVSVVHLGESTLTCAPATQTILHNATATITLAAGPGITKFTWTASVAPAGRLALAPPTGNEAALIITGTPVTDVHVDETITVSIKALVTEATIGGKAKKLRPVTANLACMVTVLHRNS